MAIMKICVLTLVPQALLVAARRNTLNFSERTYKIVDICKPALQTGLCNGLIAAGQ